MTSVGPLAFRDVVILAAAVVGVGGSYLLYRKRGSDTARRFRSALYAEIATMGEQIAEEANQTKSAKVIDEPYLPQESPIVPTVYRNSAGELGRLTTPEVEALTSFYTEAELLDDRLRRAIAADEVSPLEVLYLGAKLVELDELNETALAAMEAEFDEPFADHLTRIGEDGHLPFGEIRDRFQSRRNDG